MITADSNEKNTNVEEIQHTSANNFNVQQNQMTLPMIAVQTSPTYQNYLIVKAVGPTPPKALMQEGE